MSETSRQDPHELGFRAVYRPFIVARTLTAALRPGNRNGSHQAKGVTVGEVLPVRVITIPGDADRGIAPVFDETVQAYGHVTDIKVKPLGEMTEVDLQGCSPDSVTWQLGAIQLGLIYNRVFTGDDQATVLRWEYID